MGRRFLSRCGQRSYVRAGHNAFSFCFDYAAIADRFAEAFGAARVLVRPYRAGAPALELLEDFGTTIGADERVRAILVADTTRYNPRFTFGDLLERLRTNASDKPPGSVLASDLLQAVGARETHLAAETFAFLSPAEAKRIGETFALVNRAVAERYGVAVPHDGERVPTQRSIAQGRVLRLAATAWRLEKI